MPILQGEWRDLRNQHILAGPVYRARVVTRMVNGKNQRFKVPANSTKLQLTIYMAYADIKSNNNYLILPIPNRAELLDMDYPGFFEDLQMCFPATGSDRIWSQINQESARRLKTTSEICDWASLIQKPISPDVKNVLKQYYSKFHFLVVQVQNVGEIRQGWIGPFAWIQVYQDRLFIPTRHHYRSYDLEGRYGKVDPVISKSWDLGQDDDHEPELFDFETKDPDPRDTRMLELVAKRRAGKTPTSRFQTPKLYVDTDAIIPVWDHSIYVWNKFHLEKNPLLNRPGCRFMTSDKVEKLPVYLDPRKMPSQICHGKIVILHKIEIKKEYKLRLDLML